MADGNNSAGPKQAILNKRALRGGAMGIVPRALSYLIPRSQWAQFFGQGGGGSRNVYTAFGYPTEVKLANIWHRYARGGIAKRIVDAYPDATWGTPPDIVSSNPKFVEKWNQLNMDHDLWSVLHRLDILSRLGQYAVMVVGTNKPQLSTKLSGASEVIFLQPYAQLSCQIKEYDKSQTSPRFGRPKMYNISAVENQADNRIGFSTPTGSATGINGFDVHHTRLVHVAQGLLEDNTLGRSTLLSVWNYLLDLEKIAGASAEGFWISANRGMQIDVDSEMELDPETEEDLSAEVDEYMANLRRVIRTKGVKINQLDADVADPKGPADLVLDLISGSTGIPRRVLLGTESGQLASTQDKGNWAERVEEYRLLTATPYVLDPFIWTLVEAGILPDPEDYEYVWPDAYRLGPLERGQQSAQTSRTMSNLVRGAKEWQGMAIQRKQLRQAPKPPTPGAAPVENEPNGPKKPPNVQEERTPVEDDLAHESSGQQSFGGEKGAKGSKKPVAGMPAANPSTFPVDLPDIDDDGLLLTKTEIRTIIGLSTDGRVLDDKKQVVKGRKRRI